MSNGNQDAIVTAEKLLQYNTSTRTYVQAISLPLATFCNGFSVRNIGNTNLIIDGDTLSPGQAKTFGGNRGEVFIGRVTLAFSTPTPAPSPVTNMAIVTEKFYTNIKP